MTHPLDNCLREIEALGLRKQELLKLLEANSEVMMKAAARILKLETALREIDGMSNADVAADVVAQMRAIAHAALGESND